MSRPTVRTALLSVQSSIDLDVLLETSCISHPKFYRRYLAGSMSYQTYYNAISGGYSAKEVIDSINTALEGAEREQARILLTHCPHCKAQLD